MPDTQGFADDTVNNLGIGIDRYFKRLYPVPSTLAGRLRAIVKHYGSQEKAGHAIGISGRTIRRWLTGRAVPIKRTLARAEKTYLRIHLAANGFTHHNDFERQLATAWSNGFTPRQLGLIAEEIMTKRAKVPVTLTMPKPPTFTPGMAQMDAPGCEVSDGDRRWEWLFNTGTY